MGCYINPEKNFLYIFSLRGNLLMLSEGPGLGLLRFIGIPKNLRTAKQRRSSKVLQLAAMALLRAHWHFDPTQP